VIGPKEANVQYMLLIYSNEHAVPDEPGVIERFSAFSKDVREAGKHVAADRLRPAATASTVRVRDGEPQVTDGPFAETKEQLGGFYILDCEDLDEALAYAAKIPTAEYGSVEVRPVWEM
jgi:hypothetical protein